MAKKKSTTKKSTTGDTALLRIAGKVGELAGRAMNQKDHLVALATDAIETVRAKITSTSANDSLPKKPAVAKKPASTKSTASKKAGASKAVKKSSAKKASTPAADKAVAKKSTAKTASTRVATKAVVKKSSAKKPAANKGIISKAETKAGNAGRSKS